MRKTRYLPWHTAIAGLIAASLAAFAAPRPAQAESVIHAFDPLAQDTSSGPSPQAVVQVGGTIYGTTEMGGTGNCTLGCGTIFSIDSHGNTTTVHDFQNGTDGVYPTGPLAVIKGVIYGVAGGGSGPCKCGVVFSLTTAGAFNVIYTFKGGETGSAPVGLSSDGNVLLGATASGGRNCPSQPGCGTIFSLTTTGKFHRIAAFAGDLNGQTPAVPPIAVNGAYYGVTKLGGINACEGGCGTIYKVEGGHLQVLYRFTNQQDGDEPAGLVYANGQFIGIATYGGIANSQFPIGFGTVFSLTPQGNFSVIYQFQDYTDGAFPISLVARGNNVYGLANQGGAPCGSGAPCSAGTVFSIKPGKGFDVVYTFKGGDDPYDPQSLIFSGKSLLGVAEEGGDNECYDNFGCGTVFELKP